MNDNPISDVVAFFLQPVWTTVVFWPLVLGSIAIAVYVYRTMPSQRTIEHVGNWVFRLLIGCMWWQQTLWKLPPFYTDHPDQPFGETGLAYWMGVMGKSAANRPSHATRPMPLSYPVWFRLGRVRHCSSPQLLI